MEIVFLKLFHISCVALQIVIADIQYLSDHQEEFIASNVENSWLGYLNTMSMQGTWCDGLIVQAVANALGITLHRTIIKPAVTFRGEQRTIYLGYIHEVHYVSTVPDVPELLEQ